MAKVSFYLKPGDNPRQLHMRYSHAGKPVSFYTGYRVPEKKWDSEKEKVKGGNEVDHINTRIRVWKAEIQGIITQVTDKEGREPDSAYIKARFAGVIGGAKEDEGIPFIKVFDDYLKASRLKDGTRKSYNTFRNHFLAYEKELDRQVVLSEISSSFMERLTDYFERAGTGDSTVATMLMRAHAVINWAVKSGMEVDPTYRAVRSKVKEKHQLFLTESEFMRLWNMDRGILTQAQRNVLECYLLGVFTGMRYSDIIKVNPGMVKGGFIRITQTKTDSPAIIPINAYSRAILDRNGGRMPRIDNRTANVLTRSLCQLAGINDPEQRIRWYKGKRVEETKPKHELITFHSSRATFIMHHLSKGIAAEAVMRQTGHKNYAAFQRYVRVNEELLLSVSKSVYGEMLPD